ncbi:hypothetical protein FGO68_gene8999 [Halteria grandinella]|uniref:Cysteine-rich PDZ-binding protein n=1 Tax=Halteria grandinella TaxID=5974 RepID=A0A8J8NI77_HALGN|nr:hypothetical protein FGO68_gene8999 [Halteria grandinella]
MVCDKCEKKLDKVITPEVKKAMQSKAPSGGTSSKEETKEGLKKQTDSVAIGGGAGTADGSVLGGADKRSLSGMNMQIANKNKYKFDPLASKCRICKVQKVMPGHYYCQHCSYVKGICSMCGVKIINTKMYKQSTV